MSAHIAAGRTEPARRCGERVLLTTRRHVDVFVDVELTSLCFASSVEPAVGAPRALDAPTPDLTDSARESQSPNRTDTASASGRSDPGATSSSAEGSARQHRNLLNLLHMVIELKLCNPRPAWRSESCKFKVCSLKLPVSSRDSELSVLV